jgi:hypothetical protein
MEREFFAPFVIHQQYERPFDNPNFDRSAHELIQLPFFDSSKINFYPLVQKNKLIMKPQLSN